MSDFAQREAPYIRARLETLRAQIEGVGHGARMGGFVLDVAGERQTRDDWAAGRIAWEAAWRHARRGLEALDRGDHETALSNLIEGQAQAIAALGTRLRPDDLKQLAKPAKTRGRKKAS